MSYWGGLMDATRMVHERHKTCVGEFEKKNLGRMGTMAFCRTCMCAAKLGLALIITLKVFEVI
jgi:hypothetical protein